MEPLSLHHWFRWSSSRWQVFAVAILGAVFLVNSAYGQEGKWSLSRLNPFKSKKPDTNVQTRITDQTSPSFPKLKMPQMPTFDRTGIPPARRGTFPYSNSGAAPKREVPSVPNPPTARSKKSGWARFTSGTKNLLSKTQQTLTPSWSKKKAPPQPFKITGSRSTTKTKTKQRKSFFPSMFPKKEPEPQAPLTVSDFLKQPRERF